MDRPPCDSEKAAISRDNNWVLSALPSVPVRLMMYPTGAGTPRRLDNGEFTALRGGEFLGDGSRVLVCGNEPKKAARCYVRPVAAGKFRPITSEGVNDAVASPDGEFIVALTGDGYRQFSVRDGASQRVPGITADDQVIRYSPDGRFVWTRRPKVQPVHVEQIDIKTGARSALLPDFSPRRAGVLGADYVTLADDPHTYAWVERENASYLFELKGMK